jgi:hypothetical protein
MGAVGVLLGLVLLVRTGARGADGAGLGGVLAPGGGRWSIPGRWMAHAVTEPVLASVRRVLPRFRRDGT